MKTIGQLTPELYWEWRASVAEMELAKLTKGQKEMHYNMLLKDLEINKLGALLYKGGLEVYAAKVEDAKREYEDTRKKIEALIGQSLDGCSINASLEVIKLED